MRFVSTLRGRLIVSHLAAVLVGVIAIVLTAGPLTKRFFSSHIADMGFTNDMMGGGANSMMGQLESSLADSYGSALFVALVVSALTAVVASIVAARWIASPIEQMSHAARRLARGEYRERVPVPDGAELATLAEDINTLADSLANAEEARLRLINEIAHELRTPLTTIEGYMEGLLDGVFEPTDEVFGATAREAGRLKRLADDLSVVSRAGRRAYSHCVWRTSTSVTSSSRRLTGSDPCSWRRRSLSRSNTMATITYRAIAIVSRRSSRIFSATRSLTQSRAASLR